MTTTPPAGERCPRSAAHRRRRAATALLAVGSVSLLGAGAFASWQATSTASTGTVTAAMAAVSVLDANGSSFTAQMPDLLPADYWYRYVDLRNDGSIASQYTGTITATGDLSGALTAQVERCSVAWTGGGSCLGATTVLLPASTVDQSGVPVDYATISQGPVGAAHVRYRFMLKDSAPQTLMGKTGTLSIAVSGTATGGRDRTGG